MTSPANKIQTVIVTKRNRLFSNSSNRQLTAEIKNKVNNTDAIILRSPPFLRRKSRKIPARQTDKYTAAWSAMRSVPMFPVG